MKHIAILLLSATALALVACNKSDSASGGPSVGSVTRFKGNVTVERSGKQIKVSAPGFAISDKDVLVTAADSAADLELRGRGVIQVASESRLALSGLADMKNALFGVESGSILAALNKLKKEESLEIRTPAAIAGVRGTSFQVSVRGDKTKLGVLTGSVEIKNQRGDSFLVEAKKEIVSSQAKLSASRDIRGSSLAEIKEMISIEGVQKLKEYPSMIDNIKSLEILDQKSAAGELGVDKELWGSFVGRDARDAKGETLQDGGTTTGGKKKSGFSSDKDMMVK